jgi:hypothetical protein
MKRSGSAIQKHLEPLVGLVLSIARRAADMRVLHFGAIQQVEGGTVGQYALHIQCPWRLDGPVGVITGSEDLWESALGDTPPNWNYEDSPSLQDSRLAEVLRGYDTDTKSHVNTSGLLEVERIEASVAGDATIYLSGGYRLVLFPCGTRGEAWRIFSPEAAEGIHFVVEGEDVHAPKSPPN